MAELRSRYGAAGLGPRSEDILRACLTTLTTETGRYTLCEVEPLLTNPGLPPESSSAVSTSRS